MVLVGKEFACIKISGRANFNLSVEFKTLITELQRKGYAFFVLELSECVLMDSTFLGVLAGLVLKTHQPAGDLPGPTLQLRNANARIMDLFENLGVLHLFKIAEGPVTAAESLETCAPSAEPASRVRQKGIPCVVGRRLDRQAPGRRHGTHIRDAALEWHTKGRRDLGTRTRFGRLRFADQLMPRPRGPSVRP